MSTKDKLIARLKSNPKDFTFNEMQTALRALGFNMSTKGKTSGSRVMFHKGNVPINLHRPHPQKELQEFQIKQILEILESEDLI